MSDVPETSLPRRLAEHFHESKTTGTINSKETFNGLLYEVWNEI